MKKIVGITKRLVTVDQDTGEVLDGVAVYCSPKIRLREGFFMGFQEAFRNIAKDKEMTGEITRVWHYMLGSLAFENYIHISQTELAKELGMNRANISRSIKVLLEKNLIKKGPKIGQSCSYILTSTIGWKGKVTNLQGRRKDEILRLV